MKIARYAAALCFAFSIITACIGCGDGQERAASSAPDPGLDPASGSKLSVTNPTKK